ncbi:MAG: hypothetical protein Ta2A_24260 [Treponemataceae bacterium]|nr:MAG: hypothetical protein Ta2A_24260 [Treponemataceae bacterium]
MRGKDAAPRPVTEFATQTRGRTDAALFLILQIRYTVDMIKTITRVCIVCALFRFGGGVLFAQSTSTPTAPATAAVSSDYKSKYTELLKSSNYDELATLLAQWEKAEPKSPEMCIAYFNYYIFRDRSDGIALTTEKPSGQSLALTDPKTGETAGYIGGSTQYKKEDVLLGIRYLDKGMQIAPSRLDIHFGKIQMLNEIASYKDAADELYRTILLSLYTKNQWLWSDGEPFSGGETEFLNALGNYYAAWLGAGTKEALSQVKRCTDKQIELYPKSIFAYNAQAVYYVISSDNANALKMFLKAEAIDPNDSLVLMNIARLYRDMGDTAKAKEYFTSVTNVGTSEEKKQAQAELKKL